MTTVVRQADTRTTMTPNATMTTYASPTLGASRQAVWEVAMVPGAVGPEHWMDGEQVWTVRRGSAVVTVAGQRYELAAGDTAVLPAGVARRIHADPATGMTAMVTGPGGDVASGPDREPVVPPWIA